MLVLTRKCGQSIVVGDNVEVKVLELHGNQVKLGVEAPQEISIHRKEIYIAIQQENRSAAAPPRDSEHVSKILRNLRQENN